MLITGRGQTWSVPEAECFAEASAIHHRSSNRTLTFGELVAKAGNPSGADAATVN